MAVTISILMAKKRFYRVEGEGPALLLIHGFPTASWDWGKVWPQLAKQFKCIALDMLGFGYSDKPNQHYRITEQADGFCALLDLLGIKECHVLSHDYGDTVAQELLARHNEGSLAFKMLTLNLLNGGLFPETHRPVLLQKLLLSPLGGILVRLVKRDALAKNLKKIFGPDTQPTETEIDEFWQLICQNNGHLVMHRLINYMVERKQHRERWVTALRQANIPLRLTVGMKDPISGAHLVDRYRQLVPEPDVVCLDDIGHYPQIEAPERILQAVVEMLEAFEETKRQKR